MTYSIVYSQLSNLQPPQFVLNSTLCYYEGSLNSLSKAESNGAIKAQITSFF